MTNSKQRIRDLEGLQPREQVVFMLGLSFNLLDELEQHRNSNSETAEVFDRLDMATDLAQRWLSGEVLDAEALRYPGCNDDGTDIADTSLRNRRFLPDSDIEILGSTITTMILYVAFLQYQRDGTEELPHPYEGKMDEEEIVWNLETDLTKYSENLRSRFNEIWETQFRP